MITRTIENKAISFGNQANLTIYHKPLYVHKNNRDNYKKSLEGQKRDDSISRTRITLYRLIRANIKQFGGVPAVFLTLTYADNQTSLKRGNADFRLFIKRLRYETRSNLRYVCIPEFQKRGAVHYHIMFFNLPFIAIRTIDDLWPWGYSRIETTKNIKNVAAYMAKYLTKDLIHETLKGHRILMTSKNLLRPQEWENQISTFLDTHDILKVEYIEHSINKTVKQVKIKKYGIPS